MSIFVQWENNKTPLNAENLNVINDVARQLGEDVAHLSDVVVDIDENFSAKVQNELTEVKSSINTINETTSRLQQQTSSNNTNITNVQRTIVDNNSALEEKINTNKNNLTTLQSVVNDNKTELDGKITTNKNNLDTLQQNVNNINSTLDGKIATNKDNISNIQNSLLTGQYTSYSGTNLTCNDTLSSKTSNMVIKGQTYQNLIDFNKLDKNFYNYSNGIVNNIRDGVDDRVWDIMNNVSDLLKQNTDYTFIVTNLTPNTQFQYGFGTNVNTTGFNGVGDTKVLKFTTSDLASVSFKAYKTIEAKTSVQIKVMLLEGDWTNKEVPSTHIDGTESVGKNEENKISIFSQGKNLCPINAVSTTQGRYVITKSPIKLKPNTYYSLSSNRQLNVLVTNTLIDPVPDVWNQDILYSQIVSNDRGYEYGTNGQGQISFLNKNWKYAYITTWIMNDNGADVENLMFCEGQNYFDFEPYKLDKKEVLLPIEGGLKSLPNGTCDTIEQREDGVYLVQRIGKIDLANANYSVSVDSEAGLIVRTKINNIKQLAIDNYICNILVGICNAWDFDYWKDGVSLLQ